MHDHWGSFLLRERESRYWCDDLHTQTVNANSTLSRCVLFLGKLSEQCFAGYLFVDAEGRTRSLPHAKQQSAAGL